MVARNSIATLLLLSASTTTSAFVPAIGRPAPLQTKPLFAEVTEEATPAPAEPEPVVPEPAKAAADEPKAAASSSSSSDRGLSIVPVNESSVQFTAGTVGAVVGFAIGGPVLAFILGSILNYLSRKDGSSGDDPLSSAAKIVDTVSNTALSAYNGLAKFEQDQQLIDKALNKLEESADLSALDSVGKVIDENDLVGGAGNALNTVGDLVETGLDKAVVLAKENL